MKKPKFNYARAIIVLTYQKKMGDLLSIRKLVVRETAKQPQFNNARAIIVLAEQDSWATCGSLHQRLSSCTPT